MSDIQIIAKSIGKTQPDSITFEVADFILSDSDRWMHTDEEGWSETVQFRFEQHEEGRWDLVFRRPPEDKP